jgi:hypothetical protein
MAIGQNAGTLIHDEVEGLTNDFLGMANPYA